MWISFANHQHSIRMQVNLIILITSLLHGLISVHGQDCIEAVFDRYCLAPATKAGAQELVGCGFTISDETSRLCRKNEQGLYCGFIHHNLDVFSDAVETCLNVESEGCPEGCGQMLLDLKNNWGCCITEILNKSDTGQPQPVSEDNIQAINPPQYRPLFSYPLWKTCSVTTIPDRCPPVLVDTESSSPQGNCRLSEVLERSNMEFCDRITLEAGINDLRQQGCPEIADGALKTCGVDENDLWCPLAPTAVLPSLRIWLVTVQTQCSKVDSCNSTCKRALQDIKDAFGCCTQNLYNNSYTQALFSFRYPEVLHSASTWQRCDVPLPEKCEAKLFGGGATALHGQRSWELLFTMFALVPLKVY